MELTLHQESLTYFAPVFTACTSQECTAESVVPDRMPDVHRLLDTDAEVFLRRRSVEMGGIRLEGEIHADVLFLGEEDNTIQKLSFELPCAFTIPAEGAEEGDRLRARLMLNRAEARVMNPRKIGITAEVRAVAELYRSSVAEITTGADTDELETLLREETVAYAAEVGEKSFTVIEECTLPTGRPAIREILSAHGDAVVTDQKTVGGKCILQGNVRWALRYLDTEGSPTQELFSVPFSQLIDIPEDANGGVDAVLAAESSYAEIMPSSGGADSVSLEMHLLAQTVCWVERELTLLTDAYSIRGECRTETAELPMSAPAERLTLRGSADTALELSETVNEVLWGYVLPGIPEIVEGSVVLPAKVHALCQGEGSGLQAVTRSISISFPMGGEPGALQLGEPVCSEPILNPAGDRLELRLTAELPAERLIETPLQYITGAELEETTQGEGAPSLILMRNGGQSLWELAKRCHSTVALIQAYNPESTEELLLIPRAR